jgi:hypothetical protein
MGVHARLRRDERKLAPLAQCRTLGGDLDAAVADALAELETGLRVVDLTTIASALRPAAEGVEPPWTSPGQANAFAAARADDSPGCVGPLPRPEQR